MRYEFHSKMTAEQVFAIMHVMSSHYDIMSSKPGVMSVRCGKNRFRMADQCLGPFGRSMTFTEFNGKIVDEPGGSCIRGCFQMHPFLRI